MACWTSKFYQSLCLRSTASDDGFLGSLDVYPFYINVMQNILDKKTILNGYVIGIERLLMTLTLAGTISYLFAWFMVTKIQSITPEWFCDIVAEYTHLDISYRFINLTLILREGIEESREMRCTMKYRESQLSFLTSSHFCGFQ